MKAKDARKFDVRQLAQDFKGLNPNDPGMWPLAPRIAVFAALLALTLAAVWYFDWQGQAATLSQKEQEEVRLREDWVSKKKQAVNLDEHRRQLADINRQFGALLKQLPNRAEMDALLADINQAGLGRGLQFELFKPGAEQVKDFYAEVPISLTINGGYHDLGEFASDVAKLSRIVTLNNLALAMSKDGKLKLTAVASTYRYLDEEELAAKRQAENAAKGKAKGRRR